MLAHNSWTEVLKQSCTFSSFKTNCQSATVKQIFFKVLIFLKGFLRNASTIFSQFHNIWYNRHLKEAPQKIIFKGHIPVFLWVYFPCWTQVQIQPNHLWVILQNSNSKVRCPGGIPIRRPNHVNWLLDMKEQQVSSELPQRIQEAELRSPNIPEHNLGFLQLHTITSLSITMCVLMQLL